MTDQITDADLDERLRSADPLKPGLLPSEADTEAALRRLLAAGPDARRARGAPGWRVRLTRPRLRLLGGVTAGTAAAGTALVLLLGAATTSPAFAVTRNHDGTVMVSITRSSDIALVNRVLRALGVRARVTPGVPGGCRRVYTSAHQGAPAMSHTITNAHWTIDPRGVPRGQTLVLAPSSVWQCEGATVAIVHGR